jgi:hypothetical protein
MQGRIGYESETGRGSTFWVEFPMVTGRETTDAALPRTTAGV